jgi:predicted transcriptional regulator
MANIINESNRLIYPLTDKQLAAIEEAVEQIKAGKFLTDEEARKEIDEWLEAQ